jgi:16S rRNA (guanine(966)-N(2))-methyltransferase RsmD
MRIIAGEHRGRRIEAPPGLDTRPMLDRVREAMFSTLGERVPGANVLDLYAGSGSLGLEALSRGARRARMIEKDPKALACLRNNVELLGMGDRAQVVRGDSLKRDLWRPLGSEEAFDVVFLDPPYSHVELPATRTGVLGCIEELLREVVGPRGCLIVHAEARMLDWIRLRGQSHGALRRGERRYGSSGLLYLYREGNAGA